MKNFNEFLVEGRIKEEQLNDWISIFTWEDIDDLYEDEEFEPEPITLSEKISATSRLRKGQQMKGKSARLQTSKRMVLQRASSPQVLNKRAKAAARRMLMKKFLQGKDKGQLSAQERDRIEQRVSGLISMQPAMVTKMLQKVRELERSRMKARK